MTTIERQRHDWKTDIISKLNAIGDGIHCQQAHLLAEYAAQIVEMQLPDRKQRLAWMVAEAKRRHFHLEFTYGTDAVSYKWKQGRLRLTGPGWENRKLNHGSLVLFRKQP